MNTASDRPARFGVAMRPEERVKISADSVAISIIANRNSYKIWEAFDMIGQSYLTRLIFRGKRDDC